MATESTITVLRYPAGVGKAAAGGVFLVGLAGGTSPTPSYGLYDGYGDTQWTGTPVMADNATVLTYQGDACPAVRLVLNDSLSAVTFFAANNATLQLFGTFWQKGVPANHIFF